MLLIIYQLPPQTSREYPQVLYKARRDSTYSGVCHFEHVPFHFPGIGNQVLHSLVQHCLWVWRWEDCLHTVTRKSMGEEKY